MKSSLKIAVLIGVLAVGASPSAAQMEGPPPPDGPMQGMMRSQGRLADRLIHAFDLNHDGKVSHDEMNRTIGARFSAATHRAPYMTSDQFAGLHQSEFRQHTAEMFRRLDWDGNGTLSLTEYGAPQRVRFLMMDRGGIGVVSCAPSQNLDATAGRGGRSAVSGFCFDNDVNRDGRVMRPELDGAVAKRFAAATGGAPAMTAGQYAAGEQRHFLAANARVFRRLDRDGDGRLTVQEFGGSELRLFSRVDRNHDGVLTAGEMRSRIASNRPSPRARRYD